MKTTEEIGFSMVESIFTAEGMGVSYSKGEGERETGKEIEGKKD